MRCPWRTHPPDRRAAPAGRPASLADHAACGCSTFKPGRYRDVRPGPQAAGDLGPRERGLLSGVAARLDAIDSRLSAIEQRVGTGPDTGDLDQQIEQARGNRQAAADAQEYEQAAALRDRKSNCSPRRPLTSISGQQHPDLPSLAGQCHSMSEEIGRLRVLLRQHGIEPEHKTA